jgi:hypothetical protein
VNIYHLIDEIRTWPEHAATSGRDFGRGYSLAIKDVEAYLVSLVGHTARPESGKPLRLLDLCSGAGGAAMGYHRAGFEVVGVDIEPMPRYPFEFHQADAFAPLRGPIILCGTMFPELRVYRHRLFETNWPLVAPPHREHLEPTYTVNKRSRFYGMPLDLSTMRVQVTGGGNAPVWAKAQAMGIDWMTNIDLNEAIPPAYTQHIGRKLLAHLQERVTV